MPPGQKPSTGIGPKLTPADQKSIPTVVVHAATPLSSSLSRYSSESTLSGAETSLSRSPTLPLDSVDKSLPLIDEHQKVKVTFNMADKTNSSPQISVASTNGLKQRGSGIRSSRIQPPPLPVNLHRSCSANKHSHPISWFHPNPSRQHYSPPLTSYGIRSGGGIGLGPFMRRHWRKVALRKPPSSSSRFGQRRKFGFGLTDPGFRYEGKELSNGAEETKTPEGWDESDEQEQFLTEEKRLSSPRLYSRPEYYYFSTSRKAIKSARMEQGPREYTSCKDIGIDFCARTSSHGIPFVGTHSFFGRIFWAIATTIAFCAFAIQTYFTLSDYLQYRTIIEMQLKFEPAPFPAATICNLNAFKLSEVKKFEEIEQGIQLWEKAISQLNRIQSTNADPFGDGPRQKRQVVYYRPIYVKCVCTMHDSDQCIPQRNAVSLKNASICICYEDAKTGDVWPCYLHSAWKEKTCLHCNSANTCDDPEKPNVTSLITVPKETPCLCQSVSHHCLVKDPKKEIKWWNPFNYTVYPSTDRPPLMNDTAWDVADLKDLGAITTKTKENLIFLVAGMSREVRKNLSYTLDEFVLRCSFNSKDCDLRRDFHLQIDPEYGNCYTFNFNDSVELKNSRAGPMYGLRLLLNVNQSDYMPTTEAAGVRLVVHEQDQEPFPDTFGYSAPTGFVSSFGLKTKKIDRLGAPYGKCSDTFRPKGYIYAEHYSPEGCYRNCFQNIIVERCGCGDPRFPLPSETDRPCDAHNVRERACLANETSVLGGFHHLTHDCHCVQPCTENVFETAYSAAAWPAENFNIGSDCALVLGNGDNFTLRECTEYYRQNTAYIEIYYEQLNFESLRETPGYTLVNLFSDLGGNIGLWIGFSLITVLEVIELIFECLTYTGKMCIYRPLKKKRIKHNNHKAGNGTVEEKLMREKSQSKQGTIVSGGVADGVDDEAANRRPSYQRRYSRYNYGFRTGNWSWDKQRPSLTQTTTLAEEDEGPALIAPGLVDAYGQTYSSYNYGGGVQSDERLAGKTQKDLLGKL